MCQALCAIMLLLYELLRTLGGTTRGDRQRVKKHTERLVITGSEC